MLLPDGDEVEAIAPSHLPTMDFFGNCMPKCCHTHAPTHGTGPSRKLSNVRYLRPTMVLPILIGTSGNVAAGTHMPQHKRSALKESFGLGLLQHCERFVRVALYFQINWISLAVVGGCTALFMVGAILAYDPSRGFLARRGEPGGGT
jgi:hypothetical protein